MGVEILPNLIKRHRQTPCTKFSHAHALILSVAEEGEDYWRKERGEEAVEGQAEG